MNGLQNYANLEKFHDGSNNQVFRAVRIADRKPVVIKVPRSEYPSTRDLARLYNEYHLLRRSILRRADPTQRAPAASPRWPASCRSMG